MSEHQLVTAVFRGPRLLSTMVQSEEGGVGLVHITPPDTTCDLTTPNGSQYCENSYTQGDVVILTPVPTGQSVFAGWTFGPCTGSTGPCPVTMSEHQLVPLCSGDHACSPWTWSATRADWARCGWPLPPRTARWRSRTSHSIASTSTATAKS